MDFAATGRWRPGACACTLCVLSALGTAALAGTRGEPTRNHAASAAQHRAAELTPWERAERARDAFEATPEDQRTRAEYTRVMDGFRAIYHQTPQDMHAAESINAVAELLTEQGRGQHDPRLLQGRHRTIRVPENPVPRQLPPRRSPAGRSADRRERSPGLGCRPRTIRAAGHAVSPQLARRGGPGRTRLDRCSQKLKQGDRPRGENSRKPRRFPSDKGSRLLPSTTGVGVIRPPRSRPSRCKEQLAARSRARSLRKSPKRDRAGCAGDGSRTAFRGRQARSPSQRPARNRHRHPSLVDCPATPASPSTSATR